MFLLRAVHVSSTCEFGAVFHDCLREDPQGNPPFSSFSSLLAEAGLERFEVGPESIRKTYLLVVHLRQDVRKLKLDVGVLM